MKEKIAFALLMGVITTGIISFVLISINVGLPWNYLRLWLFSWMVAYLIVVPVILVIGPQVSRFVRWIFMPRVNKIFNPENSES